MRKEKQVKNLTLKTRVLLGIMIPLILVFVVMIFTINYEIQRDVRLFTEKTGKIEIKSYSEKISEWINIYRVLVENMSNNYQLKGDMTIAEAAEWLHRNALTDSSLTLIYSDTQGNAVDSKNRDNRFDVRRKSYFKNIVVDKNPNIFISETVLSKATGEPLITIAHNIKNQQGNIKGLLAIALPIKEINHFATEGKIGKDSIAWIVDASGLFIAHPDKEVLLKARLQDMDTKFGTDGVDAIKDQILAGKKGIGTITDERGIKDVIIWHPIKNTPDWILGIAIPKKNFVALSNRISVVVIVMMLFALAIITAAVIFVLQRLLQPIKNSVAMAQTIADLDLSLAKSHHENQYSQDEMGKLTYSMDVMADKLKTILQEISESSEYIASGSEELNATSQVISNGASEQAATLEQVAASVVEMASSIQTTSNNAQKTETIAQAAASMADESGKAVGNTVESMNQIAEKIHIIQEIAGQTRLLSLNASIEAARAGDSGKGFAVVASEVSKLAELSAEAASNIEELTQRSVSVANEAGEKLKILVPEIKKTTELVKNISVSSKEQNLSIEQVNISVQEVNNVVQHNATQAEELAASSENFSAYAEQLQKIVSQFKL